MILLVQNLLWALLPFGPLSTRNKSVNCALPVGKKASEQEQDDRIKDLERQLEVKDQKVKHLEMLVDRVHHGYQEIADLLYR